MSRKRYTEGGNRLESKTQCEERNRKFAKWLTAEEAKLATLHVELDKREDEVILEGGNLETDSEYASVNLKIDKMYSYLNEI